MKEITTKKYKPSLVLKIAIIFGFVFLIGTIISLQVTIIDKEKELSDFNDKIEVQSVINEEIKFSLDEYEDGQDELIEEEARTEYDYSKIGERVFEIIGAN
ncbi:MAG: septum formation initiator family protein [Clostridia bacterium]